MKKLYIRKKLIGAAAIAAAFLLGVTPVTAFAQSDENAEETDAGESQSVKTVKEQGIITEPKTITDQKTITDPKTITKPVTVIGSEPVTESEADQTKEETYGPLTPDGNMTLVDDYGSIEAGGKQFITVVTKKGNYFYIIIDRDDQGKETVHFLNMVDEADLLSLMDDKKAQEYVKAVTAPEEEKTEAEVKEETNETNEVAKKEKSTEKPSSKTRPLVLIIVATIGGIAGYMFLKNNKKKDTKKSGLDPDADYTDEEEDYLSDLPEEDFQEEIEGDEIVGDVDVIEECDDAKNKDSNNEE